MLRQNTASIMKGLVFGFRQNQIFMAREVLKAFCQNKVIILLQFRCKICFFPKGEKLGLQKVFTFRREVSELNFNKLFYFCKKHEGNYAVYKIHSF